MPLINNKKFYNDSIKRFGISAQGVHWNSKYSQYKRFEIITSCLQKEISTSEIIDAGCGFGEYYHYLTKNQKLPKNYIGIDCEQSMINIAQNRFPSLEFYVQDVLSDELFIADYYVCSGAMNLLNKNSFFHFITQAWQHSQKGFVFNFLKEESFNEIDAQEVIAFCRTLSQKLDVHEHYLKNDLTLFLYH
ncbi:MAG: class I SAM-dependent methyltransferase [Deltaproteobacteria bacterium HGW-Deltaproteobacteria-24]|jgi:SAM-dependent methyltransferase|nr:MAG: class I SAM-dependent methyltransferase [Deltaproteobacteria bacterium HGW-Deltaproteobacteria-24]